MGLLGCFQVFRYILIVLQQDFLWFACNSGFGTRGSGATLSCTCWSVTSSRSFKNESYEWMQDTMFFCRHVGGFRTNPCCWCRMVFWKAQTPAGPTDSLIFQGNQEWQTVSQKLKLIHHASIHPVHFGKFSFSPTYGQLSKKHEKHSFCRRRCFPRTRLGRIVQFIGIWILNPLKTSGGQPMAFVGFGIWLRG